MVPLLIVAASALLSFTAAAPVQDGVRTGSLESRQAPNCNIGTQVQTPDAYDSSCWNTLNIMTYLSNWKTGTPTCTDAQNSAGQTLDCCVASEPWSTCFLRLATRQSQGYNCNQISSTGCSFPIQLDAGLDPTIAPQVNYVVLSITMINNFFSSYFNCLQNVIGSEGASLKSLSNSVSDKLNVMSVAVNSQNAVAALTLGLAFPGIITPKTRHVTDDGTTATATITKKRDPQDANTGTSSSSAPQGSTSIISGVCTTSWIASYWQNGRHHRRQQPVRCPQDESSSPATSGFTLVAQTPPVVRFNSALQQSSNVATAMWPSAVNPATLTIGNVGGLSGHDVSNVLNAGLQLIMSDIGTFIAFAGNGIFATPFDPTDEATAFHDGFTGALDTYILSQILVSNKISATPGSIVTTNPCSSGSLCGSTYWSPVTGRQYSFSGSDTYTLLNKASSSMEADLPVLFDGAYNCTLAGQAGGSVVSLKADGSLNMACLSTLPMYIDGGCPEGATFVGGKCPFGHT